VQPQYTCRNRKQWGGKRSGKCWYGLSCTLSKNVITVFTEIYILIHLFSYKNLHCVHMRKRAGPLAEISFEFAEIIGRRDEKLFQMNMPARLPGWSQTTLAV
jgi:hypothetical protein